MALMWARTMRSGCSYWGRSFTYTKTRSTGTPWEATSLPPSLPPSPSFLNQPGWGLRHSLITETCCWQCVVVCVVNENRFTLIMPYSQFIWTKIERAPREGIAVPCVFMLSEGPSYFLNGIIILCGALTSLFHGNLWCDYLFSECTVNVTIPEQK